MMRAENTMRWIKLFALLSVAIFLLTALPRAAYAQNFVPTQVGSNTDALGVGGIGASTGLVDTDPRIIAAKIIRIALGLLGVIVIGFMLYAGYLWMTAGGDEEKVATAKKVLRNAVIGLAIILSSVAITQFIISKLTAAILGGAQKSGAGGGCVGEQCFTPEFTVFYATTTPQSPPQLPIKNVVVSIDFFNGLGAPALIDQATISVDGGKTILANAITVVKQGTVDAQGAVTPLPADAQSEPFTGELKFVDQNTVEFHPVGSCADADNPANSSTNTDCFEKNTVYKVTLKNSIASKSGTALDCSTVHPCVSQFITGEKYDAEPPKISLVQPGNNALISNNTQTLVSAQVSDDAGVKKVAFYENETSNIVDKILNPFIVSGLVTDQTWKPKLSDPNKAEVVQLTAKAYDIDNHETLSSPQTVKILPAWCFNNTLDEDKGEEKASTIVGAPDCGQKSECGACQGEGCDNDLECAAGICIPQPGVKVSLTDQNTKYKAEGVGLPNPGKIIPYFEWYINGEPLTVAYLPFDKTSDTAKFTSNLSLPADALNVGQVSHATVAGPKWIATDGVIGGAYQFKNPGDYIETSVASWKGNQLSVEWWMKRAPGAVPPGLFMIAQIKDSFSIQTAGQNTVTVSAQASDTPGASLQEQGKWPLPPADNTWHQVTVVFDGSAIRYYIDGAQDPSSIPFAHVVNATNNSLVIGYKGNKGTAAFNGWIDEVRVFTRILNAQQLLADFKSITETQTPADTLDVNIAPAKALVTADVWQLSKSTYEITNTKALYREKIGICVNVPKITNVIQTSGAEDNYITVVGQSFGAYKPGASSVWFSKVQSPQAAKTDQWVNAELCNVKAWHDNYAVVKVPKSAVTGPIKIEAQSSVLPGYDGMVFRDTTADPFGPLFDPAEVFKITNEKLPGLCTVDPEKVIAGDIMKLTGTQLGNGAQASDAILLGTEDEPLNEFKEWSNFLISDIIMPATVATGVTSIKVKVNGKKSNALPLGILSSAEDTAPHIFSIDPAQGPVGTYVTFTGKNFGANGEILFSQGGDFFAADLPPAYCGATWTSNQIVVKVPQKIQNKGDYGVSVIIKKGAEETASNKKIFNVNTDPLKPGLCKLEPDNGPLFSAQFSGIEFKGEGFGDATPPGIVTFNKNAEVSDPKFFASWENTLVSAHKFLAIEKSAQAKFKTGPVSVANVQKLASNALQFKIQNCKEELQKGKELAVVCGEGNSCCASGVCEQKGQCPEDKKPGASVYMWSFTTGKLPVVPKVLEQCGKFCSVSGKPCTTTAAENEKKAKDECDKNILNDLCALVTPTPSPSAQWDNQTGICVNASVKIRFDTLVDISANNAPQMVVLYQCQDKKKCSLADEKQIVGVSYALGAWSAAGKEGTMVGLNSVSDLLPDTQYGILVTTAVKSFAGALSEFMPENPACAAPDKGVIIGGAKGLKAAYCATFTTRATKDYCELGAVVVDPSYYVTSEFNQKSANLYSATPIAKGNLCVALNGDGYNWAWSPTNTPSNKFQEPSAYADISNNAGKNNAIAPVQDLTTKDKETPFGNPEKIIATWIDPLLNAVGAIKGIGQLTIKLPNPKMVSYYPQCTTACVNAQVGAEFNVELAPESVNQQTVLLYKCAQFDVTCKQYVTVDSNLYQVQIVNLQAKEGNLGDTMSITHDPFAPNTYYKVVVQGGAQGIKSKWNIAMDKKSLNENCAPDGSSCASFAWVFRTKDTGAACAVDKVSLVPQQATVKVVGAQASFEALAIGSPDACNPNGQILDTSGKSYAWSFAPPENPTPPVLDPKTDRAVVWMSNFASGKQEFPWCTASCVKAGSASAPEAGLCGNNKVESGEECDPSVGGGDNTPEKCGWNCLFIEPKSKGTPVCTAATIAQGGCCGNGPQVLPEAGEECDIGLLNGVPGSGCSDVCLKEGTSVSYATCIDKNKVKGNPYECAHGTVNFVFGNGDAIPYKNIVVKAQSVCGNGVEEQGEACDLGAKNGMENSYCSKSCVLSLVPSDGDCGNGIVTKTMGEECDPKAFGSESIGCSNTCKKLGASPIYGSWCGDGVVGAGESCDTAPQGLSAQVSATQYATAVGMGTVKDKKQTATVSATISQAGQPSKTGAGQFILQCGFSPQNSACPNANDPGNATNGVGADSCCYKRPTVAITQPPQPITSNVCPNAVFEVVMKDGKVDDATIPGNIIFAEEIKVDDNAASCPNGSQPFAYAEKIPPSRGWWQSLIASLKKIFGLPAYADKFMYCGGTSVSFKTAYNEKANVSTITITPSAALKKNANYRLLVLNYDKNKGWGGLKDMQGLTFVNQYGQLVAVEHSFTTADVEYCKVSKVAVEPAYHLFTKKNEVQTFGVKIYFAPQGVAIDNNAQEIAQVPGQYAWDYIWNTSDTTVVNVDANALTKTVEAKAVGKNGMVTLTGGVKITQDGTLPSAKNTEITGEATAQVFLCENPWPGETVYADTNQPQKLYGVGLIDAKTSPAETVSGGNLQQGTAWNNFQTLYCKDAGKSGFEDDLPALKLPAVLYHNSPPAPAPADPILKEFFFTFEDTSKNTDSIGLRVYPNTDHKTLSEWYQSQPWIPKGNPVPAKVGAYEALQEGRTFYIAGMNIDTNTGEDFYVSYDAQSGFMFAEQVAGGGFKFVPLTQYGKNSTSFTYDLGAQKVTYKNHTFVHYGNFSEVFHIVIPPKMIGYTNVYVWSLSDNASAETIAVFNQLLANFTLNINIDNPRVCSNDSNSSCSKDLDCGAAGGVCVAPLDKATRDLKRIKDLAKLANKIELYNELNASYPNLKNNPSLGTFIPGYTNSKWLSWQGVLGNALTIALPSDPINVFNGCGGGDVNATQITSGGPTYYLKDFDAQTCWNAQNSTFACPQGSYVYQYEFSSKTKAVVKADFELPSVDWKKSLIDVVGNKATIATGNTCADQVIGLSEKCGDGVVGPGEDCEIGQMDERVCPSPVGPLIYVGKNSYSATQFVPCTDTCTWSA
ncbi:MAG: IPT/TIG domain-containing protein, partial [Candidatus Magasanikbacteria bacterium]|nr:IPT/TIG domain-containing protein [Candidatus Magasanikbacteria bacterium]